MLGRDPVRHISRFIKILDLYDISFYVVVILKRVKYLLRSSNKYRHAFMMFRLSLEVFLKIFHIRVIIRYYQNLAGPGQHIYITIPIYLPLGLGHILITRPRYLINFRYCFCTECQCRYRLRSANLVYLFYLQQIRDNKYVRIYAAILIRRRCHHYLFHTCYPGRQNRHVYRRNKRHRTAGHINPDAAYRSKLLPKLYSGLMSDSP